MFESHVVTSVDRTSFDFWFKDFLSNLPLQTFIYCVTDQPSITQSRRSVLNFNLSVLTFSRSTSCSMSIEQKLCRERQSCMQKIRLQVAKYDKSYTVFFQHLIWHNGLVVEASGRESGDIDSIPSILGSIPDECWKALPRLGHLPGAEPVSALTRALFILLHSL